MNTLQVFTNPDFGKIRMVAINGEPWLVGKDVAAALGYSNPRKALADHSSLEIAQIFGWMHNQVLRKIRRVLKHAEIDGIPAQSHIRPAYRRDTNNTRQMYYQLDLSGIQLLGQSVRDKSRVVKLEEAWKMVQEVGR